MVLLWHSLILCDISHFHIYLIILVTKWVYLFALLLKLKLANLKDKIRLKNMKKDSIIGIRGR